MKKFFNENSHSLLLLKKNLANFTGRPINHLVSQLDGEYSKFVSENLFWYRSPLKRTHTETLALSFTGRQKWPWGQRVHLHILVSSLYGLSPLERSG